MRPNGLKALLAEHKVMVGSDNVFQRRARLLQALWREEHHCDRIGLRSKDGKTLGSRLEMPWAQEKRANFLTPVIRERVAKEVAAAKEHGSLISAPRIWADLLSSQPLAFNVFAELDADHDLATAVVHDLWPDLDASVPAVEFEWSPGRGDNQFLGNRSAFDVFIRLANSEGSTGFLGVEVKYHEAMREKAGEHKTRYCTVATDSKVFVNPLAPELQKAPLQQIWLDHLLALSMLQAEPDKWAFGRFVFLHPADNTRCANAAANYSKLLSDQTTFAPLTLERLVAAIRAHTDATWAADLWDRYLDFSKIPGLTA